MNAIYTANRLPTVRFQSVEQDRINCPVLGAYVVDGLRTAGVKLTGRVTITLPPTTNYTEY